MARKSPAEHVSFLGFEENLFPLFKEHVQVLGEQSAARRIPVNLAKGRCALGQLPGVLDKVEAVEATILQIGDLNYVLDIAINVKLFELLDLLPLG